MFNTDVGSDFYGKRNKFRALVTKMARYQVQNLKWPTMFKGVCREQVALFANKNKKGGMLAHLCAQEYPNLSLIAACNKYLLVNYLCYVEVPTSRYNRETGGNMPSFQKRVVTANLDIVANWLGITREEADIKYGKHFIDLDTSPNSTSTELPFLELRLAKGGEHKISKPRKKLDLSNGDLNVNPLFMLRAGVDVLYQLMQEGIVRVTYRKDGGLTRVLDTTAQRVILSEIYGVDSTWYKDMLEESYNGNFEDNEFLFRGYIRVPEVGGSRYDHPTRSVNYNRIEKIETGIEPDTSYVDIDLRTTREAFAGALMVHPENTTRIRNLLMQTGYGAGVKDAHNLIMWEENMEVMHTTQFRRFIGKFMIENNGLFNGYDGSPKEDGGTGDMGIGLLDSLAGFDLDFDFE